MNILNDPTDPYRPCATASESLVEACDLPGHGRFARLAALATDDSNGGEFVGCAGCERPLVFRLNGTFRLTVKPWRGTIRWQVFETWGEPVLAHDLEPASFDRRWPLTGVTGEVTAHTEAELSAWLEQFVNPERAPHRLDRALANLRPQPAIDDALGQIERHVAVALAQDDVDVSLAKVVLSAGLIDFWSDRLRLVGEHRLELPQVPVRVEPPASSADETSLTAQLHRPVDGLVYCDDLSSFMWHMFA